MTDDRHDAVTVALHWIIAILVLALFLLATWPGLVKGATDLHKSIGMLVLVLVPLRILWRLTRGRKSRAASAQPVLMRLAANGAHWALYVLLIITPLLGWTWQDARANIVSPFGIELPMLTYYDRTLAMNLYALKQLAAYGLLALIAMHAAAAIFYHAMVRKDAVLRSILPRWLHGGAAEPAPAMSSPLAAAEPAAGSS